MENLQSLNPIDMRNHGFGVTEENAESFVIDNDTKADWAVEKIANYKREHDRLVDIARSKIEDLEWQIEVLDNAYEDNISNLRYKLQVYFGNVEHNETTTQESYKLLSGRLIMKKPTKIINHDETKLIEALRGSEYVVNAEKLKWGEYKKRLTIVGDDVIDAETGEIVNGCSIEEKPAEFIVKI